MRRKHIDIPHTEPRCPKCGGKLKVRHTNRAGVITLRYCRCVKCDAAVRTKAADV